MTPDFENDHNVYVLGAGFSKAAGYPLIREFMERMRESHPWITKQGRTAEAQAIERVLAFRLKAAAASYRTPLDPDNVEELFSLASAEGQQMLDEDMRRAIAATLDFCDRPEANPGYRIVLGSAALIEDRFRRGTWRLNDRPGSDVGNAKSIAFGSNYQVLCAALIGGVSEEPGESRRSTFITLNYDLLIDQALRASGVPVNYGFAAEDVEVQGAWMGTGPSAIGLFKLHGSVNWTVATKNDGVPRMRVFDDYRTLVEEGHAPLLVPPTWRKSLGRQLDAVWTRALDALRTATRVIVIGFSMPTADQHFRYLIAAGLRENIALRKIIFVDPEVEGLRERIMQTFRPELEGRAVLELWPARAFDLIGPQMSHPPPLDRIGRSLAADTWIHRVTQ